MKLSEIHKLAQDNIVQTLKDNGFKKAKSRTMFYYKLRGNGIHCYVWFDMHYGENFFVTVGFHTDEMNVLLKKPFPEDWAFELLKSGLSPDSPIDLGVSSLYKIKTEADALAVLQQINELLITKALPFFDSIDSKTKLVTHFYDLERRWVKEMLQDDNPKSYGAILRAMLKSEQS